MPSLYVIPIIHTPTDSLKIEGEKQKPCLEKIAGFFIFYYIKHYKDKEEFASLVGSLLHA